MARMRNTLIVVTVVALGLLSGTGAAMAQPRLRGIPGRVMLQPADLGGSVPGPVEDGLAWPLLPQPCAGTPVPQPIATRSQAAAYGAFRVYENVARYRGDGAQAYLTELKAQLTRCGVGGGENGLDPVAEDPIGPDTVLFNGNYDEGDRWVCYVASATGPYVVLVLLSDPTRGAADPTTTNGLAAAAIARATAG
jgi:hypothetical protein